MRKYMNSQNREKEIFSRLVKELRSNRNLSQREFAKLFSPRVTYQAIGQWERGEAIPARRYWNTLAELAEMDLGHFYEYVGVGSNSSSSLLEDILMKIKNLTSSELKEVLEVTIEQSSFQGVTSSRYNRQHLAILKKGVKAWNKWRERNPDIIPQLTGIDLLDENCRDLSRYNLDYADLNDVRGTDISFRDASLNKAHLKNVKFNESDFSRASLVGANLENAEFNSIWFGQADLTQANFRGASLSFTNFENANMYMANLSEVEGVRVTLKKAFLKKANLTGINLVNSFFDDANLNEASLEKATLNDCSIYGVSLWGTKADGIKLNDIYISPETKKSLIVNDLELSPTIYLHRHNPSLTKKFIQICQMEKEAVKLANILVKKYCEYSQTYGFRICSNIEQKNSTIPYCEVRETDNGYLFVRIVPSFQSGFFQKEIHEARTILTIDDGIIESNLKPEDIEILKGMVEFEEKTQKERVELIAPIVIKILDFVKSDKFIDEDYTLAKAEKEVLIITNSEAKIELMRVQLEKEKWQIINSSLSPNHCQYIQNLFKKNIETSSSKID